MSYGLHIDRNNVSNSVVDACAYACAYAVYTTLRVSDALRLFAYDDALLSCNVVMCILYEHTVPFP